MSCDAHLLKEPSRNLTELYSSVVNPIKIPQLKQEAFMVCNAIQDLNRSAVCYKAQHCNSANYEYSLTLNVVSYRPNFERAKSASSASSMGAPPPNQPKIPPPLASVCSAAASVSFDDLSSLFVCSSLSFEICAV